MSSYKLSQLLSKTIAAITKPGSRGAQNLDAKRAERTLVVSLALAALGFASSLSAHADALLDQLSGRWIGEGERVQLISKTHIKISAEVQSTRDTDGDRRLRSVNLVTETRADGTQRTYKREYWIRKSQSGGSYELGSGEGVDSWGVWKDGELLVRQDLGGGYSVVSQTRLVPAQDPTQPIMETDYEDTFWAGNGGRKQSQTRIHYRRAR